jgi:hypothetical protein
LREGFGLRSEVFDGFGTQADGMGILAGHSQIRRAAMTKMRRRRER